MQKHIATFFFLLASSTLGNAETAPACPKNIELLQKSTHFLRGYVSETGQRPEAEQRFEQVLRASNAETVFLQMAYSAHATDAARAYAVCGLSELRSRHLASVVRYLERHDGPVLSMHGGVLLKRKLSRLAARIQADGCAQKSKPMEVVGGEVVE
jgi:hypothetical protein